MTAAMKSSMKISLAGPRSTSSGTEGGGHMLRDRKTRWLSLSKPR